VIWIKGCGIIASKQLPKAGFNRLAIKKSMIGSESSITFFLTSKDLNLNWQFCSRGKMEKTI